MKYIVALDAGTTSVRAMLYDVTAGKFVHTVQQEVAQSFPAPGWVEQDANEIYYKAAYVLNDCVSLAGADNVAGLGIANQRETVVLWNRKTGKPVAPAIVWQCRRTSEYCASIAPELREKIRLKTGLPTDAYFSASKIRWILDHVPSARALMKEGNLCAGTIDSYLIFKLTDGKRFVSDYTNASRTMLFNIRTLDWDEELLNAFGVPREILPEVLPCTARFGETNLGGKNKPITGVAGDQQAALFGQACLKEGDAKITYGTGLFLLFNTGETCVQSESGLISTIGYSLGKKTVYALEGSAFNAGSSVQWLRDGLGFIKTSADSEGAALSVPDSGGVYFVPAFTGLGAPYWEAEARGLLCGITRGTTREHIVRAVLESIAYSARELTECMGRDSRISLNEIRCDGGASANRFLMQFQADVLGVAVNRPVEKESTALGAALLCACGLGLLGEEDVSPRRATDCVFYPSADRARFDALYRGYENAVRRTLLKDSINGREQKG